MSLAKYFRLFAIFALVFGPTPVARAAEPRALADTLYEILLNTPVAAPPPGWSETEDELHARLRSIAEDAAAVAKGKPEDALLLLAVDHHESAFGVDVDRGPCYRGPDGNSSRCDSGNAYCPLQLHIGAERGAQAFADRRMCFRIGLAGLKHGRIADCPSDDMQFAGYAGGSCSRGAKGSRELVAFWGQWKQRYAAELAREQAEDEAAAKDKVADR